MKNLIEELQKLNNEEEYNVPSDFKQKVIAKIDFCVIIIIIQSLLYVNMWH